MSATGNDKWNKINEQLWFKWEELVLTWFCCQSNLHLQQSPLRCHTKCSILCKKAVVALFYCLSLSCWNGMDSMGDAAEGEIPWPYQTLAPEHGKILPDKPIRGKQKSPALSPLANYPYPHNTNICQVATLPTTPPIMSYLPLLFSFPSIYVPTRARDTPSLPIRSPWNTND